MAYICLDCGNIFEEGEQATWREDRAEYCGTPCSVEMSGCPICKGDYEETTPCAICGSEHLEDDLNGGLCDDCIDKYKNDIDMCFNIGANDTDKVELNCFLAAMFDKQEIEEILFKELKKEAKYIEIDCKKFIDGVDRDWFAEMLLEQLEREKK